MSGSGARLHPVADRRLAHVGCVEDHDRLATARLGSASDAVAFGGVVLLAIPVYVVHDLDPTPFVSKVVVDACNYYPGRDESAPALDDDIPAFLLCCAYRAHRELITTVLAIMSVIRDSDTRRA